MRSARPMGVLGGLVSLLASSLALAEDIPLNNWTVPATDYLGKQVDITLAIPFVGMVPCRVVDTRPSQGFPAAWGAPILSNGVTRNFDLNSAPHCTGIPAEVDAYSVNFTIAEPVGSGDLRAYPQGSPPPVPTSVMNWIGSGPAFAIANAAIIPAGTNGIITVQTAGSNAQLIIDINGYFSRSGNPGFALVWQVNTPFTAGSFSNSNASSDAAGVTGRAEAGIGRTYGVFGRSDSVTAGAAGVFGRDRSGDVVASGVFIAGVRGESRDDVGVLGLSRDTGVMGRRYDSSGNLASMGILGAGAGGVYYFNGLIGTGTKNFIEPHPTDPSKALKFVSLEGPEAGTYFRGKGRFERGIAQIDVPQAFRMVTSEEGLSIQVTPIGEMATVAVVRIGLDGIVVKSSRNVEFFYTVNGVRRAYPTWNPVVENEYFQPEDPSLTLPVYFSPDERQRLIANGTYNADGSVNLETAKRLGWDKRWAPKEPKPAADPGAHSPQK